MTPIILLVTALAGAPGQAADPPPPLPPLIVSSPASGPPSGADPRIDERDPSVDQAPVLTPPRSGQLRAIPGDVAGALSGAELDTLVGGDAGVAVAVSSQRLEAVNTGNRITADEVVTGSVTLDRSALSNFSGLGNIVVNTGNNNNLQSSLSVSVVMPPR